MRGGVSDIEYLDNYHFYVKTISEGAQKRQKSIVETMKLWNDTLYPGFSKARRKARGTDSTRDAYLLELEADTVLPESADEDEEQEDSEEGALVLSANATARILDSDIRQQDTGTAA